MPTRDHSTEAFSVSPPPGPRVRPFGCVRKEEESYEGMEENQKSGS